MTDIRVAAEQARVALPPLPKAAWMPPEAPTGACGAFAVGAVFKQPEMRTFTANVSMLQPMFTADQMRDYALASLEAALAAQPDPVEAQAVPDLPVAWMYTRVEDGRKLLDFAPNPKSLGTWEPLFTRPTPAAADLHQQVMNLPCEAPTVVDDMIPVTAFRMGFKAARHAAAELVAAQLSGNNT